MTPVATARAEDELLLCCAREYFDGAGPPRVKELLRENIDWDYLLRTATRHGVLPLLYQSLRREGPEVIPAEFLERLRDRYNAGACHNAYLTEELLRLLRSLDEAGIVAVPFKGPLLAVTAYGDLALRQFTDLDILVREHDVLKVKALLVSRGYQPLILPPGTKEAALLFNEHAYTFVHANGLLCVDVHWRIVERLSPLHLNLNDGLWRRLARTDLCGEQVRGLSPEDTLAVLYVHGCRNRWNQLKLLCDLSALLRARAGDMNWRLVSKRARTQGSRRMLYLGLRLANGLLGADVPEEVLKSARSDPAVESLCATFSKNLFDETHQTFPMVEGITFSLKMRERLPDRLQFLLRCWTTPSERDRAFLALPPRLFRLYYLVRPVRILREHGLRPLTFLISRLLGF